MTQKRELLYTVVLDFEGTTSISQFRATGASEAIGQWFTCLGDGRPYGLTKTQADSIATAWTNEFSPTPLSDLVGVWCDTVLAGTSLALFNVVATIDLPAE